MEPDLTDLTVDEQKDELENLSKKELQVLKEEETRNTALDNIERELAKYDRDESQTQSIQVKEKASRYNERIEELEKKVEYLIDRCKTTSKEAFENYEN